MRTSLAIAALVAVGGGAATAAAATLPQFLGSDTLFQVTTQAIAACPGAAGLAYLGTGSGNGETAMRTGTQAIAPMSRFLGNGICTVAGGATELQSSQGIVIGLDGVSLLGSTATAGAVACNGADLTDCTPEAAGLAFSGSVTTTSNHFPSYTYTFTNWKDVLSVIYGGQSNASQNTATGDSGCNSDIRNTLAAHWGELFQNPSCGTGTTTCTILQHAFRRDDASGTSDIFQQLLGLSPAPTSGSNHNFGTSPFCNVNEVGVAAVSLTNPTTITTTIPHGLTTGQLVTITGVGRNIDATAIAGANIAANGTGLPVTVVDGTHFTVAKDGTTATVTTVGSYAMVLLPPPAGLLSDPIPTDYREQDPIRRACVGTTVPHEDVCNRDGKLGLVLSVVPTDFLPSNAAQYPLTSCTQTNLSVRAAQVKDPNTGLNTLLSCPNGDPVHGGNLCVIPVDASGNANCISTATTKPFVFNNAAVNGTTPSQADGRVFNTHLFGAGTAPSTTYQVDTLARPIVGAWYRIHSAHTIAVGATSCTQTDATLQVGCLVQASPCSIGYAGRTATSWDSASATPGKTSALKTNEVLPLTACVQNFSYSLSRKLYLDTVVGWSNVAASDPTWGGPELALGQCESSETTIGPILSGLAFINFTPGSAPNSGNPFSEDFNEPMLCPTQVSAGTANSVAYSTNAAPIPNVGTVCGNGIKEAYEDCDDGTAGATAAGYVPVNGGNGGSAFCTNTCRWKGAAAFCDPAGTKDSTSTPCNTPADDGSNCHDTSSNAGKCSSVSGVGCCLP
jgi:hypothetical protein